MSAFRVLPLALFSGLVVALVACGSGGDSGVGPADVAPEVVFDVVNRDGAANGDANGASSDGASSDGPASQCTVANDCVTKVARPPGQCEQLSCDAGRCSVVPKDAGAPCNDFNACTQFDTCLDASCVPGNNICDCQEDGDCAAFDDDNLCNGRLTCDTTALPYSCALNQATVVTCDTSDDTTCRQTTCDPTTGHCVQDIVNVGDPCNDDDPCTSATVCDEDGQCVGEQVCQCQNDADCLPFNPADKCEAVLFCDQSAQPFVCKQDPTTRVTCAPHVDPCRFEECQPSTGTCLVVNANDGTLCDDHNACTVGDACQAGLCVSGPPKDCDDQELCTQDGCAPLTGSCQHIPNTMPCENSFACSTGDVCQAGSCKRGETVRCDDEDPCTFDTCVEPTGCVYEFRPALCPEPDVVQPPADVVAPTDVGAPADTTAPTDVPPGADVPPAVDVPPDTGPQWPTFASAQYRVTALGWGAPVLCYYYVPDEPCVPVTGVLSQYLDARLSDPSEPLVLLLGFEPLDVTVDAGLVAVGVGTCEPEGTCAFVPDGPVTNYGAPSYETSAACLAAPEVAAPCVATEAAPVTIPSLFLPPPDSGHVNPPVVLLDARVYARFDATFGAIPTGVLRGFLTVDTVAQLRIALEGFGAATDVALLFEDTPPTENGGFQGWWVELTFEATQLSAQ